MFVLRFNATDGVMGGVSALRYCAVMEKWERAECKSVNYGEECVKYNVRFRAPKKVSSAGQESEPLSRE